MPNVAVVFGTRPEAIKLAPVIHALRADHRFDVQIVSTGQHLDALESVLEQFDIHPDLDLELFKHGQSLADLTARAVQGLTGAFAELEPDAVIVQGDTTTTFAGALAGFYQHIPIAHVEAGLRTSSLHAPFPEEANRRLVTCLADLHLAPTQQACDNLTAIGVPPERVVLTGNTGIDALRMITRFPDAEADDAVTRLLRPGTRTVLVTAHRRESWGAPMRAIGSALADLARRPDINIIVLAHPNPVVRESLLPPLDGATRVTVSDPQSYSVTARLLAASDLVVTDSGGLQEEAPGLGKPVLVLRTETERTEGLTAGVARLVGTDATAIVEAVNRLLDDQAAYKAMARATSPYGDGHAAQRCIAALGNLLIAQL